MDVKKMSDSEVMVASVMELVSVLSWNERGMFIDAFQEKYCRDCGSDDPRCQCWNEE